MKAASKSVPGRKKRCPICESEYPAAEIICSRDGKMLIPVPIKDIAGSTLADKYEIIKEINRGGMSIIYKARDKLMDRIIAVKVLQAKLIDDETSLRRFQQEAQAAAHLAHPNIIAVHDFGIAESGQLYLVMDFLPGESLGDIVKRENYVDYRRLVPIFMQTCDALDHAHKKGVIHRDLKSSNVMLSESDGIADIVTVVDFGIAKLMPSSGKQPQNLTNTGEIFGSPIYMSPEQCLGQPLDARSDIYSFGIMMYETITGIPPLMGSTIIDTMKMHVNDVPRSFKEVRPDLNIPSKLESIIFKALEKNPDARFQTMRQCFEELELIEKMLERSQEQAAKKVAKKSSSKDISAVNGSRLSYPVALIKRMVQSKIFYATTELDPDKFKAVFAGDFPQPRKLATIEDQRLIKKLSLRHLIKPTAIALVAIVLLVCMYNFYLSMHR